MTPAQELSFVAFDHLVRNQDSFVRRCLKRSRVPDADLDDAVQEVFIVAARRLSTIEDAHERAFLRGVALRVAATRRRSVMRRREVLSEKLDDGAADRPDPERLTELKLARGRFEQILAAMTHETRDVFRLVELEECSVISVACRLGIPIGTASSRLRSARSELALAARRVAAGGRWRATVSLGLRRAGP